MTMKSQGGEVRLPGGKMDDDDVDLGDDGPNSVGRGARGGRALNSRGGRREIWGAREQALALCCFYRGPDMAPADPHRSTLDPDEVEVRVHRAAGVLRESGQCRTRGEGDVGGGGGSL
jgi:hypothetical protein